MAINAVHGFERPGIWPVNRHAFGDEQFAPADILAGTSNLNTQPDTLPPPEITTLPKSIIQASSSENVIQITNYVTNSVNPREKSQILESNPDEVEVLDNFQSQEDVVNLEDRPCTTTESKSSKKARNDGVPATLSEPASPSILGSQDNLTIEDRPYTPITKKDQGNYFFVASPKPGCSKDYYSPLVLRPIPQPAKPITKRKRKLQRSTLLTSTPVKEDQKQKFEKARKAVMMSLDDVSNKASRKSVKKTSNKKTVKQKIAATKHKTAKENNKKKKVKKIDDVKCIFCGEMYIEEDDLPTENWIQCRICTQWCHEECSAFENGDDFVCDNCND